jgi:CRP/FNR family cyclic AMP-dependent transcriptional regulator
MQPPAPKSHLAMTHEASSFLALPTDFAEKLFGHAETVALPRNQALFLAGDPGDGCYRVIDGLLKVTA